MWIPTRTAGTSVKYWTQPRAAWATATAEQPAGPAAGTRRGAPCSAARAEHGQEQADEDEHGEAVHPGDGLDVEAEPDGLLVAAVRPGAGDDGAGDHGHGRAPGPRAQHEAAQPAPDDDRGRRPGGSPARTWRTTALVTSTSERRKWPITNGGASSKATVRAPSRIWPTTPATRPERQQRQVAPARAAGRATPSTASDDRDRDHAGDQPVDELDHRVQLERRRRTAPARSPGQSEQPEARPGQAHRAAGHDDEAQGDERDEGDAAVGRRRRRAGGAAPPREATGAGARRSKRQVAAERSVRPVVSVAGGTVVSGGGGAGAARSSPAAPGSSRWRWRRAASGPAGRRRPGSRCTPSPARASTVAAVGGRDDLAVDAAGAEHRDRVDVDDPWPQRGLLAGDVVHDVLDQVQRAPSAPPADPATRRCGRPGRRRPSRARPGGRTRRATPGCRARRCCRRGAAWPGRRCAPNCEVDDLGVRRSAAPAGGRRASRGRRAGPGRCSTWKSACSAIRVSPRTRRPNPSEMLPISESPNIADPERRLGGRAPAAAAGSSGPARSSWWSSRSSPCALVVEAWVERGRDVVAELGDLDARRRPPRSAGPRCRSARRARAGAGAGRGRGSTDLDRPGDERGRRRGRCRTAGARRPARACRRTGGRRAERGEDRQRRPGRRAPCRRGSERSVATRAGAATGARRLLGGSGSSIRVMSRSHHRVVRTGSR